MMTPSELNMRRGWEEGCVWRLYPSPNFPNIENLNFYANFWLLKSTPSHLHNLKSIKTPWTLKIHTHVWLRVGHNCLATLLFTKVLTSGLFQDQQFMLSDTWRTHTCLVSTGQDFGDIKWDWQTEWSALLLREESLWSKKREGRFAPFLQPTWCIHHVKMAKQCLKHRSSTHPRKRI